MQAPVAVGLGLNSFVERTCELPDAPAKSSESDEKYVIVLTRLNCNWLVKYFPAEIDAYLPRPEWTILAGNFDARIPSFAVAVIRQTIGPSD